MVEERVWTMESWVGIKAVFLNGYPFFFLYFFIGFGLVKKMAKSQMALGLGWENSFSFFFRSRRSRIRSFLFRYIHFLVLVIGAS